MGKRQRSLSLNGSVVKTGSNLPGATLGCGVADSLDLTLGFGWIWEKVTVDDVSTTSNESALFTFGTEALRRGLE